jgi:hypothetical protein
VLALDRLIPSGTPQRARVAVPDAPERERTGAAPVSIDLPALEVPTMTLAAQVEDVVPGKTKKAAPRPRKQGATNGSAPRRRRSATATTRIAPNTEDAG